jgi:glycosyltransferase involved in cell wall biosynthesis
MSGPEVTVLFATYNGARTLPRMLEALCRTSLPRHRWKLVAVDNNSTDDTRTILDSYLGKLPLEIVFESRQGKENALATGFRHLEGELVVLTDDDVIVEPDWLEQLCHLAEAQPEFSMFSGLIEPEWERPPPDWVLKHARLSVLYALNGDVPEGPIPALLVFGPNSAFRRSIIGSHYVVHDNLGPNAGRARYAMGQDTAFALRLEREGARAFHSRASRLRHMIKARYVDEDWILGRAERFGMGMVTVRPELFRGKAMLGGLPAGAALVWAAMWPIARLWRGAPGGGLRFRILWTQAVRQGILRQFAAGRRRTPERLGAPAPATGDEGR